MPTEKEPETCIDKIIRENVCEPLKEGVDNAVSDIVDRAGEGVMEAVRGIFGDSDFSDED